MTGEDGFLLLWLADQMIRLGPGLLFVICLLETAVFVGLVLPVGALIATAALLAARGVLDPAEVALAALAGAMVGDQVGFALGRWFLRSARPPRGSVARLWQGGLRRTETLLRRRGLMGVSTARAVPFVRTIMPWFAGRTGMPWPRFLLFDLLGILTWGAVYVGGGFLAGFGWKTVAGQFGELAGLVALAAAALAALAAMRLRGRRLLRRLTRASLPAPPPRP